MTYTEKVLADLKAKNPDQPEFIQAATEVLDALAPVVNNDRNTKKPACWSGWLSRNGRSCSVFRGWTIMARCM